MARSGLLAGWYGVIAIGDAWKRVTPTENGRTLLLSDALNAGATHVGYWDGRDWQHVDAVENIGRSRTR